MIELDLVGLLDFFRNLQDRLCTALEREDGAPFCERSWESPPKESGRHRMLEEGKVIERGAVAVSQVHGAELPASASARHPELSGRSYRTVGISVVIHPRSPMVPTSHMNLRLFAVANEEGGESWWSGGGFDLTPYYAVEEDCVRWHQEAKRACDPFGADLYPRFKKWCDEYFYLSHRSEARGIGGLFFDDFNELGFDTTVGFLRAVGDAYLRAYLPLVAKHKGERYGAAQREFQLLRRGRYAEFNLLLDRGTRFGLQTGGRVDSILASLPPRARWEYDWQPEAGSEEERLLRLFSTPREWLASGCEGVG
jgi:coproporphyrinogen III oxidase